MTHMMINEDVQSQIEAYRMDLARLKERDNPAYMHAMTTLREKAGIYDQDQDALTVLVAMVTTLIDEIDAGNIE